MLPKFCFHEKQRTWATHYWMGTVDWGRRIYSRRGAYANGTPAPNILPKTGNAQLKSRKGLRWSEWRQYVFSTRCVSWATRSQCLMSKGWWYWSCLSTLRLFCRLRSWRTLLTCRIGGRQTVNYQYLPTYCVQCSLSHSLANDRTSSRVSRSEGEEGGMGEGFGRLLAVCNYQLSCTYGNPCLKRHMPSKESLFAVNNRLSITWSNHRFRTQNALREKLQSLEVQKLVLHLIKFVDRPDTHSKTRVRGKERCWNEGNWMSDGQRSAGPPR